MTICVICQYDDNCTSFHTARIYCAFTCIAQNWFAMVLTAYNLLPKRYVSSWYICKMRSSSHRIECMYICRCPLYMKTLLD